MIEMLNSLNALSEDGSLFQMPPWVNPWLIVAVLGSLLVHILIIYIPFFHEIFGTTYLTGHDWLIVLAFSVPVNIIDEVLKYFARMRNEADLKRRLKRE